MEAAAKTVEVLTQRILPERPHHLSFHPQWRYRSSPGDSKRFEEWYNTRLQYLTLVSEADRGVLLTRSNYDMREEPVKPPPREVNALAKGSEKKKLSLSDYKNKKTGATSTSPPEPTIAKRKESERADAPAAPAVSSSSEAKSISESKPAPEARKPERSKPRDSDPTADGKQRLPRESVADMRLPPKPPTKLSLNPRPPSPNTRKRVADVDEESRPQKRPKPDAGRSVDERSQLPRDDAQRRKDRPPPTASSRDAPSHRDVKPSTSSLTANTASTLPNGRTILKGAVGSTRNASPGSRPRGDSLNGGRPTATGSNRLTPTKHEASSKSSVPPLLSPLHLSFGDRDAEGISSPKPEKKKREEARDGARSPKYKRIETSSGNKRQRSPVRVIPPLLSPTLPPAVEEALLSIKKASLEPLDGKAKDKDKERGEKESHSKRKKPPVDYSDDEEPAPKTQRKSLKVLLKIPKKLRNRYKAILALSATTTARKEAQAQDHERISVEEPIQPPPARKRPVAASDTTSETTALKKPRAPDVPSSSRLPAPSTPSKKGPTAMSRVSSSNSLVQTPGETVNATPSASHTADRRPNGQDTLKPEPDTKAMRDKEMRFSNLGRRLKHDADMCMKPGANPEPNPKLGYVLSLESLLAFMAGFQAQNIYRGLCNKRSDPNGWASLFPFMEFLQKEIRRQETQNQTRRYLPLYALLLLLHATAIDELVKCYAALENPNILLPELLRFERLRTRAWPQIRETNSKIDDPGLRVDTKPWDSLDEITLSSLRILRHWCDDEDIDWEPNHSLKEPVAPNPNART